MMDIAVPAAVHTVGFPDISLHEGITGLYFEVLVAEDDAPAITEQWGSALGDELAKLRDVPIIIDDWSGGGGATQPKDGVEAGYAWSESAWLRDVHCAMPSGHLTEVLSVNPLLTTTTSPKGVTGSAQDPTAGHLYFGAGRYVMKLTGGVDAGPLLAPFFDLEAVRAGAKTSDLMEFDEAIYLGTELSGFADFLWRMPFNGGSFDSMKVQGITILNPGTGYTNGTHAGVVFTGGGGSGAAASVVVEAGAVVSFTMTNNGSGYTSAPTITLPVAAGVPSAAGEFEARVAPKLSHLGRVFWETENSDNVYTGRHRLVGSQDRRMYHLAAEGGSGANGIDDGKWAGPIILDGFGNILSFASAPRHIYAAAQTGIYDVDTVGNTPNLTPHLSRRRDDILNGAASIYHGGYVYYTTPRGLERVYVGDQLLHEERMECGPGAGLSNETPIYGKVGLGYSPYALASDGPYILLAEYNGTDSYVSSGIDRRTSHRPEGPTPMIWNMGELYIPGERVTHMKVYSPSTGLPRLWIFSIDASNRVRIRWVPIPAASSLLQELRQNLSAAGAYTGDYRWSTITRIYQTNITADYDNARKVALRWDARTLNLNVDSFIRVFARDEHETSWRQQGSGADPKMQTVPRSELLPYTAGTDQVTIGFDIATRVDLISPDTAGSFGSGGVLTALMGIAIEVTAGGSGYTNGASVTIDPPTLGAPTDRQAVATVIVVAGAIIGVNIIDRGSGYLTPPNSSVAGGTGAAFNRTLSVDSVRIDNAGSLYRTAPRLRFRGAHTSAANASVTVGAVATEPDTYQKITTITVTSNGAGFLAPPSVELYGLGSNTPPVLRQLQLRARVIQELREARTYLIPIRTARSQRDGAIDMADAEALGKQLIRLQTAAPVRFIDETGVTRITNVEPGMKIRWLRFRPEGSRQYQRELVATMEVSFLPTDPSELQLDAAVVAAPPAEEIDPRGFRWGDGTKWGEKVYS